MEIRACKLIERDCERRGRWFVVLTARPPRPKHVLPQTERISVVRLFG